jgi:hypothetical protein
MDFTLESGATLKVSPAPWDDANLLRKSLLKAAKGLNIDLAALKGGIKSINVADFLDPIIEAATDDGVETALFKCGVRATYENLRVDKTLFDDIKYGQRAREDYHEICIKIIEVNCKPLFKNAFSVFTGGMGTKNTSFQESPSTSAKSG